MMFHRARKCLCLAHSYSIGSLRSVKSFGVSVLSLHGHQIRTRSWLPREQPLNHAVLHTSAAGTRARTKGPLHIHHAVLHTSAAGTRARTKGPLHIHHAVLHTSATSTRARTKGPQMHETQTTDPPHKLLVIQPEYKTGPVEKPYVSAALKLEEGVTLVDAIAGWEVKGQRIEAIRQINSKYLFGTGKIKELKADVRSIKNSITGVFINTPALTPVQHKHLTAVFKTNVFDRFGIVLRIFKERAVTREAKLQVDLAEIPYLRAKLSENRRDSGTGAGGETAVMAIKARLNQRQKRYKMELDEIRSRRKAERGHRARHVGLPIVAVVGYTNAGKTSLIKSLTQDDSMNPENKLFATLDSTMHAGRLPCGLRVLYVDTIGFISDLPHELVESFASTLEDVTSADVLVSVTDVSHPQSYAQRANVLKVLSQLNPSPQLLDNMVDVLNKADRAVQAPSTDGYRAVQAPSTDGLLVSATSGQGNEELLERIQNAVLSATGQRLCRMVLPATGPQLSWLHGNQLVSVLEVKVQEGDEDRLEVLAVLSDATLNKFTAKFTNTIHSTYQAQTD